MLTLVTRTLESAAAICVVVSRQIGPTIAIVHSQCGASSLLCRKTTMNKLLNKNVRNTYVEDIMATDVVTVSPAHTQNTTYSP